MPARKKMQKWTIWDYATSWGFIGSCVTLNNPFDLVRFRLQVMPVLYQQGHLFSLYNGCWDCAKRVYNNEGVRSFFKGNFSNMLRIVPSQALVWQVKQLFQRYFHYHSNLSDSQHLEYNTLIGITASMIVSLSLYPMEYIRQLVLNRTDRQGRSIWHYVKKTVHYEGLSGMYRGCFNFTLGLILFRGTYFGIFDTLKVKTDNQQKRWLASWLATYTSIMVAYPFDTIRRRFVSSRGKYDNSRTLLKEVIKKEGIRGLFLGWPMVTFQSLNACTIFFFYDRLITDYDQALD